MNKKPHGHYCRICGQYKANEKFSGRGHAAHICKDCAKRGNKAPTIETAPPVFIDADDIDIDCFVMSAGDESPKPKRKPKPNKAKLLRAAQKKSAKTLLCEILANGEVRTADVMKAASSAGIPREALRRAKGSLKIRSFVTKIGSVWQLPKHNNLTVARISFYSSYPLFSVHRSSSQPSSIDELLPL